MPTVGGDADEPVDLPLPADVEPAWYGVYFRAPRTSIPPAVQHRLMFLIVALATVGLLVSGGSSLVINLALAGAVGLAFGTLTYLSSGGREVGISIGPKTVCFGRRGADMHFWPRDALTSVTINGPWRGEPVAPAIARYLVPGYRYLTLERRDGVVAHVSLDSTNRYSQIIEDVLVRGTPLPELTHPPATGSHPASSTSSWQKEGAVPSNEPLLGPAPTPATITAAPSGSAHSNRTSATADSTSNAAQGTEIHAPEETLWRRATERHDTVLLAYVPYEVDPHMVMQYPAITDIACPTTAKFVEALSDTSALRTETYPSSTSMSTAYRETVAALEVAWNAAERYARSVELTRLEPADRRRLEQARKLLAHAESATAEAERSAYFQQVKALMDDLARSGAIVEPPKVRLAIATRVAQSIAAASGPTE